MILGSKINVWLKGTNSNYIMSSFGPQQSENIINLPLENNHFQILHEIPGQMVKLNNLGKNGQTKEIPVNTSRSIECT